jgi:hypothetical protein
MAFLVHAGLLNASEWISPLPSQIVSCFISDFGLLRLNFALSSRIRTPSQHIIRP